MRRLNIQSDARSLPLAMITHVVIGKQTPVLKRRVRPDGAPHTLSVSQC
jgi:hypothetical protein